MQLYYLYKVDPKVDISGKVKDSRWATALVWNNNLIISAHGKTPEGKALNDDTLSLLPTTMFKEEARGVDNITVIAGHLHNSTENNFSKKKTAANGVTVVRNGSPSGDGAWDSGNLYRSDKSHQVYVFDANRGLYSTVNLKLTKEELERGISMPGITDETDYIRTVERSITSKADDILLDDIKKLYRENEKQIRSIEKKYAAMIINLENAAPNEYLKFDDLSEEDKRKIYTILGFDAEIKPYLERRAMLRDKMDTFTKGYQLGKKKK